MSQTYYDNIKKPRLQDIQLGILKFMHFPRKLSRWLHVQETALWELHSIFLENIPKNLLVQWRVQLENISHIKISVKARHTKTSTPDVYWRKQPNWQSHLELCHRKPDFLESMLNWIALFNSTVGRCAPTHVEK